MTTTTTTTGPLLHRVLDDLALVVEHIGDQQLHDPTPCPDFDVEALRNHVLSWLTSFAAGTADPDGRTPDVGAYHPSGNPADEVHKAAEQFDQGLADGAAERPLWIGESSMPGELALEMILWEYQVHGWDLARATGQPWTPPEEAAERSLRFAPGMLTPDYQGPGKPFADPVPVPDDAPAFDRLLGLSGRNPDWRPSSRPHADQGISGDQATGGAVKPARRASARRPSAARAR
jgi:uncharacterized protein (TIGR03086 family)